MKAICPSCKKTIEITVIKNDGNAGLPTDYDIFLKAILKLDNIEVYPVDAPGKKTWQEAVEYCEQLGNGWRLPTKEELNLMYIELRKKGLGSLAANYYWSSSEDDSDYVWSQDFDYGGQYINGKDYDNSVRPVRTIEEG